MTPGPSFTMPAPASEEVSSPSPVAPSPDTSAHTSSHDVSTSAGPVAPSSASISAINQPKQCARCGQQLEFASERQRLLVHETTSTSAPSPSSIAFAPHPARQTPSSSAHHHNLTSAINAAAAVALARHLANEEGGFATNPDGNPICSQCAVQLTVTSDTSLPPEPTTLDVEMSEMSQHADVVMRLPSDTDRGPEQHPQVAQAAGNPDIAAQSSSFPPLSRSETSSLTRTPSSSVSEANQRARLRSADQSTSSLSGAADLGRSGSFSRSLSYHGSSTENTGPSSRPVVVSFPSSLVPSSADPVGPSPPAPAVQPRPHITSVGVSTVHNDAIHQSHVVPIGVRHRQPSTARRTSRSGSSAGPTTLPLAAIAAQSATNVELKYGPSAVTRPRLSNKPMHVIASDLHDSAQRSRPSSLVSSASAIPTSSSLHSHDLHRATRYHRDPITMEDDSTSSESATCSSRWFDSYKPDPVLDVSRLRTPPRGRGCLYPGATFNGTQKSGRNSYDVTVRIVNVDLETSHLCGYLNIRGLTEDWPELTTYFDAEIIGDRYGFVTGKWGATEADDLKHWARFPPFRPLRSALSKPGLKFNHLNKPFVFMRWKEKFLVPDHRVRDINGASFAGFYYVCVELGDAAGRPPTQTEAGRGRSNSALSSNAGSPPASSTSMFSTSPPTNAVGSLLSTGSLSSTAAATGQQWYAARTQRRRELSLSSPQYPVHPHGLQLPPLHSPPSATAAPGFWPSSPTSPVLPSATMQEDQFPPFPSISNTVFDDLGAGGKMSGFYFHENSEPYQQLSLHHTAEATSSSFEMR